MHVTPPLMNDDDVAFKGTAVTQPVSPAHVEFDEPSLEAKMVKN